MLFDLVHGKLDEILVDFGAHRGAQIMGIRLAEYAESARRGDQDQRLDQPGLHRGIEAIGELAQEPIFLLFMLIGLLHGAAFGSNRAEGATRGIGSELVHLRIGMLVNLPGSQVEKFFITGVL